MEVKVATFCLRWSQASVAHPRSSSPQTLASTVSSPPVKRCISSNGAVALRHIQKLHRSALLGTNLRQSGSRSRSSHRSKSISRVCSASMEPFSEEEFEKQLHELSMKFQTTDEEDEDAEAPNDAVESDSVSDSGDKNEAKGGKLSSDFAFEPPDWPETENLIPASIEQIANSVDLPVSLRMIKKKRQWQEGFREAGESAYCSVKKAFSNMVLIIRELHFFTLQMREMLLCQDLQGVLSRVQKEVHASFVWLFQQVFSHTPTLMVYIMILLANYSVHSMTAMASQPVPAVTESVSTLEDWNQKQQKFNPASTKTPTVSSSGKTASIGGNSGGGGKFRPVPSGTDGDGSMSLNSHRRDGVSVREEESVSGQEMREEEVRLWNSVVEEAMKMRPELRDGALDEETMQRFVSPLWAEMERDDYGDYVRTELLYQMGLAQDPLNPLLLANYAQFLYLVAHDYQRAEECFKRAVKVEPPDAEALSKYASFLWQAKKDLWAAEEAYLDAISADPTNSYHAANYAHFLWNTGGKDTCFPIDAPDTSADDV